MVLDDLISGSLYLKELNLRSDINIVTTLLTFLFILFTDIFFSADIAHSGQCALVAMALGFPTEGYMFTVSICS